MGLDMYLSKKTYVKQWSHNKPEDQYEVSVKRGGVSYPNIKPERVSYITEEVMYWRKANQIHGWIVSNCEEREPEIKYDVTRGDLEKLLETCEKVLGILNQSETKTLQVVGGWKGGEQYHVDHEVYDNTDEILELLPPTQGFFFGSDNIDEWYKSTIEETITMLKEELSVSDESYGSDYEYYASW
jgi:hypothetical protein